jgi:hypothetical protein
MKVYQVDLELKSPTLITYYSLTSNLSNSVDVINGGTIRGALLNKARSEGIEVDKEVREPKIRFHPAYPRSGDLQTFPAHPFMYKCKVCKRITDLSSLLARYNWNVEEALRDKFKCEEGHMYTLNSIGGSLIYYSEDRTIREFKHKYVSVASVAKAPSTGASERGLLYNYVCIAPGSIFSSIAVDPEDGERMNSLSLGAKPFSLYIGRGGSRGLGHAEVKVTEITHSFIEKRTKKLEHAEKRENILWLARSGVFGISGTDIIPEPSLFHGKVIKYWSTGTVFASGFSLLNGWPKARMPCINRGSLFLTKTIGYDGVEDYLEAELMGCGQFSTIGLNIMEVLDA